MTKQEELKVLEQVRNLISGTELLKKAFEGVLELAEENISCDFWLSFPDKLEYERNNLEQVKKDNREYRASTEKVLDDMTEELTMWKNKYSDMCKTADEWEQEAHDAGEMYCDLEQEIKTKNAEIVKLKAELAKLKIDAMSEIEMAILYDRMTGKGV